MIACFLDIRWRLGGRHRLRSWSLCGFLHAAQYYRPWCVHRHTSSGHSARALPVPPFQCYVTAHAAVSCLSGYVRFMFIFAFFAFLPTNVVMAPSLLQFAVSMVRRQSAKSLKGVVTQWTFQRRPRPHRATPLFTVVFLLNCRPISSAQRLLVLSDWVLSLEVHTLLTDRPTARPTD